MAHIFRVYPVKTVYNIIYIINFHYLEILEIMNFRIVLSRDNEKLLQFKSLHTHIYINNNDKVDKCVMIVVWKVVGYLLPSYRYNIVDLRNTVNQVIVYLTI